MDRALSPLRAGTLAGASCMATLQRLGFRVWGLGFIGHAEGQAENPNEPARQACEDSSQSSFERLPHRTAAHFSAAHALPCEGSGRKPSTACCNSTLQQHRDAAKHEATRAG